MLLRGLNVLEQILHRLLLAVLFILIMIPNRVGKNHENHSKRRGNTVGEVCLETGRRCVGIELKPEYAEIARRRLGRVTLPLAL